MPRSITGTVSASSYSPTTTRKNRKAGHTHSAAQTKASRVKLVDSTSRRAQLTGSSKNPSTTTTTGTSPRPAPQDRVFLSKQAQTYSEGGVQPHRISKAKLGPAGPKHGRRELAAGKPNTMQETANPNSRPRSKPGVGEDGPKTQPGGWRPDAGPGLSGANPTPPLQPVSAKPEPLSGQAITEPEPASSTGKSQPSIPQRPQPTDLPGSGQGHSNHPDPGDRRVRPRRSTQTRQRASAATLSLRSNAKPLSYYVGERTGPRAVANSLTDDSEASKLPALNFPLLTTAGAWMRR